MEKENITRESVEIALRERIEPILERYKEVWVGNFKNRTVFFCRKKYIWWIEEQILDLDGEVVDTSSAKLGKEPPWKQMGERGGLKLKTFLEVYKRIK